MGSFVVDDVNAIGGGVGLGSAGSLETFGFVDAFSWTPSAEIDNTIFYLYFVTFFVKHIQYYVCINYIYNS